MTQAPADALQAATEPMESMEPFALARRGLPLITRNGAPLRAPWLPPQLCSRAQAVPLRARLPQLAPTDQDADDPQWLQPLGVFPQALPGEAVSVAQASDDEPWWMEAAEWLPADAPQAGPQPIAEAAMQPLAAQVQAAHRSAALPAAASVRPSPAPPAAALAAKPLLVAHTLMGAGAEGAVMRQGDSDVASIAQAAQEVPARPLPQAGDVQPAAPTLAAPSQGSWQIEVRHTEHERHSELVIERAPSSSASPTATAARSDTEAQTGAARQSADRAEPAIAMQRMGRQVQVGVAAMDVGRSAGARPSKLSDRQAQLAQIQAQTQAAGSGPGPRIHIDHVQVTVDAPARSAAPAVTPPAAASAAAMASAPAAASAAMAAPTRAYANAWSTYFARAD